jgi:hypothetical protein
MNTKPNILAYLSSLPCILFMLILSGNQLFRLDREEMVFLRFWLLLIGFSMFLLMLIVLIATWIIFYVKGGNKKQSN